MDDLTRKLSDDQKAAATTLDTFASGGAVKVEDLKNALNMSGDFATLAQLGVSAGYAMAVGIDNARLALDGTRLSVGTLSNSFPPVGSTAQTAFGQARAAADALGASFDRLAQTIPRASAPPMRGSLG